MQNEQDQVKLVCFICGRKQPKSNLTKHLKGCERRYKAEQEKKTKQPQKTCPLPPKELQEVLKNENCPPEKIEIYNQRALAKYKSESQPTCKVCLKQFNSQMFASHEASCQAKPKTPAGGDSSDPKRNTSYGGDKFGKPKVLMCPICGRQFGLSSLKIHHPQCVEKFNNEESKKPKTDRRELPVMDEQFTDMIYNKEDWDLDEIEQFNNESQKIYRDKGLVKCQNCGRSFFVDSLAKHQKNCKLISGDKGGKSPQKGYTMPKDESFSKPRAAMCHICGRQFGTKSLLIHQKQCTEKWINEERKKQKAEQRPVPELPQSIKSQFDLNTLSSWTAEQLDEYNNLISDFYNKKTLVTCPNCKRTFLPESLVKHLKGCQPKNSSPGPKPISKQPSQQPSEPRKPKTLVCYICGREFGLVSLKIHQNQCQQKYRNEEAKKQIDERKDLPEIQQRYVDMMEEDNWTAERIEEFNSYMSDLYKNAVLEKCYICGRTFFHQALLKHKATCVKKENKEKEKPSPPQKSASPMKNQSKAHIKQIPQKVKEEQEDDQEEPEKKPSAAAKTDRNQPKSVSPQKTDRPSAPSTPQKDETPAKVKKEEKPQTVEPASKSPQKISKSKSISKPEEQKMDTSIVKNKSKKQVEEDDKNVRKATDQSDSKPQPKLQENQSVLPNQSTVTNKIPDRSSPDKESRKQNNPQPSPQSSSNAEVVKLDMVKCKFCDRKFAKDRIDKHLIICPKKVEQVPKKNPLTQNTSAAEEQPQSEVQLEKCSKCHRKFAANRIDKHYEICKGTKQDEPGSAKRTKTPTPVLTPIPVQDTIIEQQPVDNQTNPLVSCGGCGRKFKKDRLEKHESICKEVINKKDDQQTVKTKTPTMVNPISVKDSVIQQQPLQETMTALVPCSKCGRKFNNQRLQKHESICKVEPKVPQPPPKRGEYKLDKIENASSIQQSTSSIDYQECSKCRRKFAKDRMEKHEAICKGKMNQIGNTKQSFMPKKQQPKKEQSVQASPPTSNIPLDGSNQFQQQDLETCEKCHRKFLKQRLEKHKPICKGQPMKHIKIQTPLKQNASNVKASQESKEFMKMISQLKNKKKSPSEIQAEIDRQVQQMRQSIRDPKIMAQSKPNTSSKFYQNKGGVKLPEI